MSIDIELLAVMQEHSGLLREMLAELREMNSRRKSRRRKIVDEPSRIENFHEKVNAYISALADGEVRDLYLEHRPFRDGGTLNVNAKELCDYIQSDGKYLDATKSDVGELLLRLGWRKRSCSRRYYHNGVSVGPKLNIVKRTYWTISELRWLEMCSMRDA